MENILGKRIEFERNKLGLNQIELARKLNLSSSASISQYESGDRVPSDDIKLKMCEIFDCSLDYLLGKTDIRNPGKQIDDVLNEAMIGMSKKDYEALTETQKKQIRDFALFIKKQNEANNKEKWNGK